MELKQAGLSRSMQFSHIRRKLEARSYLWAYIVGTGILLGCSTLWWFTVFIGPKHVFWNMIENSLSTERVVLETNQSNSNSWLRQLIHVDTGRANMARSLTTLKQGNTEVKTEMVGTKDADYIRYLAISSDTKADVSRVKNVWSKSDETQQQTETQAGAHQLYAQATLGIGLPLGSVPVPVGSVTLQQRKKLYDFIRTQNVYAPDFGKVKKERTDGRLLYTYDVTMQTILYVSMMKAFAEDLGLHELEAANPNSYRNNPTLKVSITVDALSHRLARVNFTDLGYSQAYTSYGLPLKASVPKQTISSGELQKRLDEIDHAAQ
jgi:hypothetical protein